MKNKFVTVSACIALLVLASSCATTRSTQPDVQAVFGEQSQAPADFRASYPLGSQSRREKDVDSTLASSNHLVFPLLKAAAVRNPKLSGKLTYALALGNDGTVEGMSLLDNSIGDQELTKKVSSAMFGLKFGPAIGNGYYVVFYQFRLNAKA